MADRGPDGRFGPGNQSSAGRGQPIVPADWTPPASAGPARGYSWAPFQPGHPSYTQTHGALTERITAPLVRERVAELLELAAPPDSPIGYLLDPTYGPALIGWARAETQAQLVADWLEANGLHDAEGRLRQEVEVRRRLDEQAANARSRLGLDPLSRSKLFGNLAEAHRDVAAAEAQRRLRERQASREEVNGRPGRLAATEEAT